MTTLNTKIYNIEDYLDSDEIPSTQKPRESMEDTSPSSPSIFHGMNIETLAERRTTTAEPGSFTAYIEEIYPTEDPNEKKMEKGIYKTVKTKVVGWKDKVVRKWNEWVG